MSGFEKRPELTQVSLNLGGEWLTEIGTTCYYRLRTSSLERAGPHMEAAVAVRLRALFLPAHLPSAFAACSDLGEQEAT